MREPEFEEQFMAIVADVSKAIEAADPVKVRPEEYIVISRSELSRLSMVIVATVCGGISGEDYLRNPKTMAN